MNLRERVLEDVLRNASRTLVLELVTGLGKTKIAIEKIKQLNPTNILIVIPVNVLKTNWIDEFTKWNAEDYIERITFTTYVSLKKHTETKWDMIILDEGHRLSEANQEILPLFNYKNILVLSATLSRDLRTYYRNSFRAFVYKVKLSEAIEDGALPDPDIHYIPLSLEEIQGTFYYQSNYKNRKDKKVCTYKEYVKTCIANPGCNVVAECTAYEYYKLISRDIDRYKDYYFRTNSIQAKHKWLRLCNSRLKFLGELKNQLTKYYLKKFEDKRILIFCTSIEQAKEIGVNDITSKNKDAQIILERFNSGEINHISAVSMLDEGVNLNNCEYTLFIAVLASERLTKQRLGRALRHQSPKVYYFYFKDTREEEIINKIKETINE